jgi:purine-binding chemotaxis protein CheW
MFAAAGSDGWARHLFHFRSQNRGRRQRLRVFAALALVIARRFCYPWGTYGCPIAAPTAYSQGKEMNTTSVSQRDGAEHLGNGQEFLAFKLGNEEYGIDILKVQEIRGYEAVTRIANAPEFIKGVINLRGIIIPVVDMRIKFNLGTPVYDQFTVVIILNIKGRIMGMVVDSVSDVTTLAPEQIKAAPDMGSSFDSQYMIGLGTLDERMLILVDIDRLMSSGEMGLMENLAV